MNDKWTEEVRKLNEELNKRNQEISTNKSEHAKRMELAMADYARWKQEADAKFDSRVRALEAEIDRLKVAHNVELVKLNKEWEAKRCQLDITILDQQKTIEQLRGTILHLEGQVRELTIRVQALIDIQMQLKECKDAYDAGEKERDALRQALLEAKEFIEDLENKYFESRQEALELLKQLKHVEGLNADYLLQIENLQNYIIDLKSRIAVYIPVKNDKIDKKIAEYINNYPERQKLKIMFMRESEGVYQFGSKRVMVKIDNDKINIRVGGGFLSIDEFLDQYTPEELQKLERKDPMKRFNEKMTVSKSLQGHMVRDNSPTSPSKRR